MTTPEPDDADDRRLDAGFAALRARSPRPDGALLARVLADAERHRPGALGWRGRFGGLFGPVAIPATLTGALLVGVWIGAAPPGSVLALEEALFGVELLAGAADPADLLAD